MRGGADGAAGPGLAGPDGGGRGPAAVTAAAAGRRRDMPVMSSLYHSSIVQPLQASSNLARVRPSTNHVVPILFTKRINNCAINLRFVNIALLICIYCTLFDTIFAQNFAQQQTLKVLHNLIVHILHFICIKFAQF